MLYCTHTEEVRMNFSKSKYTCFMQCPKMLWLNTYHKELAKEDAATKDRMDTGNVVGDLAMGLFGNFEEMTAYNKEGNLDHPQMLRNTADAMKRVVENICEAAFAYNGLYCAVDILRKEKDGYAIYEVKSSTSPKHVYIVDVSYQKYVLEKCGVKVTGTYIVTINNQYVFNGTLDIQQLFKIHDVWNEVEKECDYNALEARLAYAEEVLASKDEPNVDIGLQCRDPYNCAYWEYCSRHIPTPSVFDIYGMHYPTKVKLYKQGVIKFEDVKRVAKLNEKQIRQIDFVLEDKPPHVDKKKLKNFLDGLYYPLYFLDFETMRYVVPELVNSRPYQQIPFQYSLHYIEKENGEVQHKEFLGISGEDPRRALAERLVADIPQNACVLTFNDTFERTRCTELATLFPDLSEKLLGIRDNIQDLLDPFRTGYYYNKDVGNSFSIKVILPALFPGDPDLDYHNLDGVHNGGEAMTIFPLIKDMPPAEQEIVRKQLLEYCKLDTYAMVKIWQKLRELCK